MCIIACLERNKKIGKYMDGNINYPTNKCAYAVIGILSCS